MGLFKRSPSLLLIIGVGLVVLAVVQLGWLGWVWQRGSIFAAAEPLPTQVVNAPRGGLVSNPSVLSATRPNLSTNQPNLVNNSPNLVNNSPNLFNNWSAQPHNPILGNPAGQDVLIILTDTCRPTVAQALAELSEKLNRIKVIIKYYPTEPAALDAGILQQLAFRQGYFDAYWQRLCAAPQSGLAEQVQLIEKSGFLLADQRAAMGLYLTEILTELTADIATADSANLGADLPVFILNGQRIQSVE